MSDEITEFDLPSIKSDKECWENFGNAVIEQACTDYIRAVKKRKTFYEKLKKTQNKSSKYHYTNILNQLDKDKDEAEAFLNSEYASVFTTIDTKMLLEQVKQKLKKEGYKI